MVPDLLGYPLDKLTSEFEDLGLSPFVYIFISDEPSETILFIDRMGQYVSVSESIEVHISGGFPDWDNETSIDSDSSIQPDTEPGEDTTASEPSTDQPELTPVTPSAPDSSTERYEIWRMMFGGIDWLVLDEKENKMLLLSEFVLFDKAYNDTFMSVTWEYSTIRSYLNNEFFNSFSPKDRGRIAETRVTNNNRTISILGSDPFIIPAGNDTVDRVFLLSINEVRKYFPTRSERSSYRSMNDVLYPGYEWAWWLRSPGFDNFFGIVVALGGVDSDEFMVSHAWGIRPAMWLYTD
jgi:hypothetical protein